MTDQSPLMAYLLTTLAALFAPTLGDPDLARLAAQQAIDAYQPQDTRQQLTATQIVAFAVTALDSLRLSMPPDLSLPKKLRLRANANALNRSARDNTQRLEQAQRIAETQPTPAPEQPKPREADWATAMKTVAARLQATPATPAEQATNALWIESLTGTANEIAKQPTSNRTKLLHTTSMTTNQRR